MNSASVDWPCWAPRCDAPTGSRSTIGTLHLAVAHVVHLGRLVDDLVHGAEDEVAVLHLGDRPHARHRRADRGADDRGLRDRRVDDALAAELVGKPERHGEAAAEAARHADVLAEQEDGRVGAHGDPHGIAQRLRHAHAPAAVCGHRFTAALIGKDVLAGVRGGGSGLASANATAASTLPAPAARCHPAARRRWRNRASAWRLSRSIGSRATHSACSFASR